MPRTTSTIPDDLHRLLEGSVKTGIFENKSDGIRCVLREYFERNEQARVAAVVYWYEDGEMSLGSAARIADVSNAEMRTILREHDIDVDVPTDDNVEPSEASDAQARLTQGDASQWKQK